MNDEEPLSKDDHVMSYVSSLERKVDRLELAAGAWEHKVNKLTSEREMLLGVIRILLEANEAKE